MRPRKAASVGVGATNGLNLQTKRDQPTSFPKSKRPGARGRSRSLVCLSHDATQSYKAKWSRCKYSSQQCSDQVHVNVDVVCALQTRAGSGAQVGVGLHWAFDPVHYDNTMYVLVDARCLQLPHPFHVLHLISSSSTIDKQSPLSLSLSVCVCVCAHACACRPVLVSLRLSSSLICF